MKKKMKRHPRCRQHRHTAANLQDHSLRAPMKFSDPKLQCLYPPSLPLLFSTPILSQCFSSQRSTTQRRDSLLLLLLAISLKPREEAAVASPMFNATCNKKSLIASWPKTRSPAPAHSKRPKRLCSPSWAGSSVLGSTKSQRKQSRRVV